MSESRTSSSAPTSARARSRRCAAARSLAVRSKRSRSAWGASLRVAGALLQARPAGRARWRVARVCGQGDSIAAHGRAGLRGGGAQGDLHPAAAAPPRRRTPRLVLPLEVRRLPALGVRAAPPQRRAAPLRSLYAVSPTVARTPRYAARGDLHSQLRRFGSIAVPNAQYIFAELCDALRSVHRQPRTADSGPPARRVHESATAPAKPLAARAWGATSRARAPAVSASPSET